MNERLAQAPEAYLLGLATFAKDAATEVVSWYLFLRSGAISDIAGR